MWKEKDNSLTKQFEFEDFVAAMEFVNFVAEEAEKQQHHPDIEIHYDTVQMTLTTHDEGEVTKKDHDMAEAIDDIYDRI